MNINEMMDQAKQTVGRATAYIKEKTFNLLGTPAASITELAAFIPTHHDTKKATKTFLGKTFTFYDLETMGIRYYLEMKGPHILQLDAQTKDRSIVAYRSYRDHHKLDIPIRFP
ncbi:hypothetical protein [Pseudobacillus wudalianchiensis]|uniref:Uncharacterized protein n=1 Tax=Pseudobacillus wudalianchiensis TaxID=1743143 RepID=A0A1B9ATE2_9BACI|nr:hypothetical protein [Bacillus wudalianchiensis]OCA87160.1 hypothetical protein A8F95_07780 [Bacillus wudalianchiensis]